MSDRTTTEMIKSLRILNARMDASAAELRRQNDMMRDRLFVSANVLANAGLHLSAQTNRDVACDVRETE